MTTRFPCSGSYRAHLAGEGDHVHCPRCGELVPDTTLEAVGGELVCPACIEAAGGPDDSTEDQDAREDAVNLTEGFLAGLRAIHATDPRQSVADLSHDEHTEGYARRHFRTNFKE